MNILYWNKFTNEDSAPLNNQTVLCRVQVDESGALSLLTLQDGQWVKSLGVCATYGDQDFLVPIRSDIKVIEWSDPDFIDEERLF